MSGKISLRFCLIFLLVMVVVLPAIWFLFQRLEGEIPSITMQPSIASIGESQTVKFTFLDGKSGIRKIRIIISKDGKEEVLYDKEYPSMGFGRNGDVNKETIDLPIELKKLGFSDGRALLHVAVWDHSWRGWWNGNKQIVEKPVMVDSHPPEIDVLTKMHNLNQGGSGLVIYKLSESCDQSGVMVGDHFYPGHSGYFDDADIFMAFFALDHQQGPGTQMYVKAIDRAGNAARSGFPHYIRKKRFKKDILPISDHFLDWKMPEFKVDVPEQKPMTNLQKYLYVNRNLRKANYEVIVNVTGETDNILHWEGDFLRLPNSATRATFADHREYQYKGEKIDEQIHMGIDLASVKQVEVPASNAGKVVFAEALGIYGKSVILDHGFGLFSMYSHLSRINVEPGKMVSKGDVVGNSGTTGLAAGDHLHFSMLVHDTFVNPIEWWDAHWIKNNITSKIGDVKAFLQ